MFHNWPDPALVPNKTLRLRYDEAVMAHVGIESTKKPHNIMTLLFCQGVKGLTF